MLSSLRVQNFKAWQSLHPQRLAPITGIFGANSAGKTSLLQFLLLLQQTVESADRSEVLHYGTARDAVMLGSLKELLFGQDTARQLRFELAWRRARPLRVQDPEQPERVLLEERDLAFEADIAATPTGAALVERMAYRLGPHQVEMQRQNGERTTAQYELSSGGPLALRRRRGRPAPLPAPNRFCGFPSEAAANYQNGELLADLELALQELLGRIYYLGPLREHPQRDYRWSGSTPRDVGRRGERAIEALLSAQDRGLRVQPGPRRRRVELPRYVAEQLRQLQLVTEFKVAAVADGSDLYRVWVRSARNAPWVLLTDVGFGVSQILPVVVLLYYAPEGSIILLEQPEIHVHPRVQAGLADLLIDAVKSRGVQIIVESHSEHLLRRLQRRIAEEDRRTPGDRPFTQDDCALYFCQHQPAGAALVPLELDAYGSIANWPDGFFGDDFAEILSMRQAVARRRMAAAE